MVNSVNTKQVAGPAELFLAGVLASLSLLWHKSIINHPVLMASAATVQLTAWITGWKRRKQTVLTPHHVLMKSPNCSIDCSHFQIAVLPRSYSDP